MTSTSSITGRYPDWMGAASTSTSDGTPRIRTMAIPTVLCGRHLPRDAPGWALWRWQPDGSKEEVARFGTHDAAEAYRVAWARGSERRRDGTRYEVVPPDRDVPGYRSAARHPDYAADGETNSHAERP